MGLILLNVILRPNIGLSPEVKFHCEDREVGNGIFHPTSFYYICLFVTCGRYKEIKYKNITR